MVDDDTVTGDVPDFVTAGIAPIYAPAYVLPLFDTGKNTTNVTFRLNTAIAGGENRAHIRSGKMIRPATEDYWGITMLKTYQTDLNRDQDPNLKDRTYRGVASRVNNVHGIAIAEESMRDWIATPVDEWGAGGTNTGVVVNGPGARQTRVAETLNHEIGHLFGMEHRDVDKTVWEGALTAADPNGGVMNPTTGWKQVPALGPFRIVVDDPSNVVGARGISTLTQASLDMIRDRDHPGD